MPVTQGFTYMRIHFFTISFFYLLLLSAGPLTAQTEETSAAEILENYIRESAQPAESNIQEFVEYLERLQSRPLNLNRASREELLDLHLLNDIQIENLLEYRTRTGPLLNEYELQAVPGWELSDIRRVLPFVKVGGDLDTRFTPLRQGFVQGKDQLLLRWGRAWPGNFPSSSEGDPFAMALRYQHNFDNRMRFGLTAEKDPGEAFFAKSNPQGFDFYSAHFFLSRPNRWLQSLALGDFTARFGQGLLLQTGFALGKTAETTNIIRSGARIRPYASFGEAFFLRGGAATVRLHEKLEVTALYANRRRDANRPTLPEDPDFITPEEQQFTTLQSSGLHRTPTEIEDEKAVREEVAGLSASYLMRHGHVSVNGLHIRYDRDWQPSAEPYNRFDFAGRQLTGASVDYAWHRRNYYFFGETAGSGNKAVATVNGLLVGVDRRVTLSMTHRWLPARYQSIYAAPFAETSGANNEHGLYIGADIRPSRPWQINLYADVWRTPWLSFRADGPSDGREYLARIMWTKRKVMSAYLYWKWETKLLDNSLIEGLGEHRTQRFRIHAQYKVSPSVELRSRAEWAVFQLEEQPKTQGFMVYQEAVFKKLGFPLSGSVRYGIFQTDDFETRIFAYENDIFSAYSVPAFSGKGTRWYLNLNWRMADGIRMEARYEETRKLRSVTETEAPEPLRGIRVLARFDF